MNCNYKVKLDDIQNKYKFNIFCTGSYNDSDLRKMIESVFYALPRTTASGTSLTLNDTARSYMHNELNATETSQDTTIGKNQVGLQTLSSTTTSGLTYSVEGDILSINGTASAKVDFQQMLFNLTQNTSKTLKFYLISGTFTAGGIGIHLNESQYTQVSFIQISYDTTDLKSTKTIELANVNQVWLYAISGSKFNNAKFKVMLSDNASDEYEKYSGGIASPNPDYPQVIHTITGDNTIKVENKNLCYDKQVYNSSNLWLFAKSDFLEKTFTISFTSNVSLNSNSLYLKVDRVDKGLITTLTTDANNKVVKTITLTDAQYNSVKAGKEVILQIYKSGATFTIPNDAMIVNGEDTTYQPYQSNSVLLTLGDKEICKIGNYEDKIFKAIKGNEIYDSLTTEEKATLDYGKWYLKKNVGKETFNGTENWVEIGTRYSLDYSNYSSGVFTTICDKFINSLSWSSHTAADNTIILYKDSAWQTARLSINYSSAGSLSNWKSWLSTNNLIVYRPLATPTNELFNDTIQDQLEDIYNNMLSYEGQTNVSQVNDDLPFNINSTAIKDLNDL